MSKHTMNVSLTPELEDLVQSFIKSGLYGNQSEVVRAALRLLHEREQDRQARLHDLRNNVGIGLQQVLAGEGSELSAELIKEQGRRRLKKHA